MSCQDFERLWNELIDARVGSASELERVLEDHARVCPHCQSLGARYQTLRHAIHHLAPAPLPSEDFVDRCVDAWQASREDSARRILRLRPALTVSGVAALAAAIFLAVYLGGAPGWLANPNRGQALVGDASRAPVLVDALADVTSATWDLARETSAPAARLGRDVIDAAALPETLSGLPAATAPEGGAAAVLQRVGDEVNERVRPLSGSARHAFSFLIAPALGDSTSPPTS